MGNDVTGIKKNKGCNDITIYLNSYEMLADEYIQTRRSGDDSNIRRYAPDMFYYISNNTPKADIDDIYLLDSLFNKVFLALCFKYNISPAINLFSIMLGYNDMTLPDWCCGRYKAKSAEFGQMTKKWFDICGQNLVGEMQQGGASVNQIFIAKSLYNYTETAPVQTINHISTNTNGLPVFDMSAQGGLLTDNNEATTDNDI